MRKLAFVSIAAVVVLALSAGTAQASAKETVVMTFENIVFGLASDTCPGGVAAFDTVSPSGAPLGTGSTCLLSFTGCEPFRVGCHQKIETVFTFALSGRGPIIVAAKLHEVLLDDDPFTLAQRARGTVVNRKGHLHGGGTVTFTPEGIESTLVYVLRLRGQA
jgi:hypothetical protein